MMSSKTISFRLSLLSTPSLLTLTLASEIIFNLSKVTYTASSKKIKAKNGKITLSKGIKKGTYKVTVKVAKTKNYSAYTKTVTIKVK